MAAVDELGYQVNLTARHLRAGRTDTIAFIAPSFHDYFGELADKLALPIEAEGATSCSHARARCPRRRWRR
ncbi:hypothetical protein [Homoserinibacter gongjuensis]|nr:hypothetical protein [Homoserinibacter gongjuensis]